MKIKIRLPILIIENLDIDGLFLLSFADCFDYINMFIFRSSLGSSLSSSNTEYTIKIWLLFDYCDCASSSRFGDGIVEAFEGNDVVLLHNCTARLILHLKFLTLNIHKLFRSSNLISFSCSKSFK